MHSVAKTQSLCQSVYMEPRIRAFDCGARSELKRPVKRDTISVAPDLVRHPVVDLKLARPVGRGADGTS